jgi:hypothetical protein
VWGSEFTAKVATLQGHSAGIAPTLNAKLWNLVVGCEGAMRVIASSEFFFSCCDSVGAHFKNYATRKHAVPQAQANC